MELIYMEKFHNIIIWYTNLPCGWYDSGDGSRDNQNRVKKCHLQIR